MANLASYSILDKLVKKYKDDYLLDTLGAAFEWVTLELILNLNAIEIDETLVDDGMDGGIDAVHIVGSDVHIFTCTYAETFDNASKNFPQNKLDNLIVTVQKIFSRDLTTADVNPALWDKVQDIWSLLSSTTPTLHFHICSNKEKPMEAAVRRFEESMRAYHLVNFEYYDLEDIVSIILRAHHPPVNGEFTFIGRSHFQKSDGSLKATVATVCAEDLVKLIADPTNPSAINDHIFNDNVRVDLGLKNAINRGIKESALSEKNHEFWYLNNGIMLVCDKCDYVPNSASPKASLTNVQIVNGGQTSRTLFYAYLEDPERVKNVDILVRIVETDDRSISEKISETANRQTPVNTRDLHANDWIQRKLEEDFLLLDHFYERKKNQHADKVIDKKLDSELLAQISLAYYLDMPSEARNSKSIVFGEQYSNIFDEDTITASRLLFPYLLFKPLTALKREIQSKKRRKISVPEKEAFISLSTFHILFAMKLVAQYEELDLSEEEKQDEVRKKAISCVWEVASKEVPRRGELFTYDRFFKEKGTNQLISEYIYRKYQS